MQEHTLFTEAYTDARRHTSVPPYGANDFLGVTIAGLGRVIAVVAGILCDCCRRCRVLGKLLPLLPGLWPDIGYRG